ncbi:substrate-binding domain-containing protein [Candidatus Uhrbacteria bacterium]|nr:substrate-binding domain-containing protein [Candidatus Uhrbacteria bacterium]
MKWDRVLGVLLLLAVVVSSVVYLRRGSKEESLREQTQEEVTISLLVGGEKIAFLQNPKMVEILKNRYGITLDASKAGSMQMVATINPGKDCLWPSNQVASEFFQHRGGTWAAKENIFSSPLVFYAWDKAGESLAKAGMITKKDTSYYLDLNLLVSAISAGKKWSDIGLTDLYGKIRVSSTDPNQSSSGTMFTGLLLTMLNHGETPTESTVDTVLPQATDYFRQMGTMEQSSSDLFTNFLKQGIGARPIIAGYENQLVEFSLTNPEYQQILRDRIRTIYPVPTTWSEHPLIALNSKGKRLIQALKDPEIQKIAWEEHGFRSGLMGVQNDPKILAVTGIPEQVTSVIPMPSAPVMEKILTSLGTGN